MDYYKQNIFTRISSNRANLTAKENEIANYILEYPKDTSESTITTLSEKIGVSEASVNRFCKKIGFKGYNDFKIAVAQDSYYRKMQDKKRAASSIYLSESLAFDYTELINLTSENMNQKILKKISTTLSNVNNIYIVSSSDGNTVGTHFHYQLLMLSIPSMIVSDLSLLKLIVNKSNDQDLFFVISQTGNDKDLNRLLEVATQNNSSLFLLTSYQNSALSQISNESIIIPNRLSINQNSLISSFISYIFVIDLIVGTLVKSNKKYIREKLENEGITTGSDYLPFEF